jgi:hypothetical protein
MIRAVALTGAALGLLVPAVSAQGEFERGAIPIVDLLEIRILDDHVIALLAAGGDVSAPLRIGERVQWMDAKGAVGVVLTDQRIFAVSADSAAWQTSSWLRTEVPARRALIGGRVALIATRKRAIGFDGGSGNLVESSIGPRERILDRRANENVAVVVTDRRALGLSAFAGGFFDVKLDLGDPVQSIEAGPNLATITTDHRLLTFRAHTGSWSERRLRLD